MSLDSVTLRGWMPFADSFEIRFASGMTLVSGPNNGGKSAFLESIAWCLTGWNRKRYDDDLVHINAPECSVAVQFTNGVGIFRSRARGHSTKVETKDPAGNTFSGKRAKESIHDLIGIDSDAYFQTVHVRQGEISDLARTDNTGRRAILFSWLEEYVKDWSAGRARAVSKRKQLDTELSQLRLELESLRADAGRETRTEIEIDDDLRLARDQIALLTAELTSIDRTIKRDRLVQEIEDTQERLSVIDIPGEPDDVSRERDELAILQARTQELSRISRGQFSGLCPLTSTQCPASDYVSSHRESVEQELIRIRTRSTELDQTISSANRQTIARQDAIRQESVLSNRLESLRGRVEDLGTCSERNHLVVESELQDARQDESRLIEEQHTAQRRIRAQAKIADLESREHVLASELESVIAFVRAVDAVDGPLAAVQTELSTMATDMLSECDLSVRLDWARETRDLVPTCTECESVFRTKTQTVCSICRTKRESLRVPDLSIHVDDGVVEEDIRYKSGGAQQLVCLALRLAACSLAGVGWIILDEVDGALTAENRGKAMTVIENACRNGLQAIVVTQDDRTVSRFPNVIRVIPEQGASRLEVS